MKSLLKSFLNGSMISSLLLLVLGLILILIPGLTMTTLVRVGAGFLIAAGAFDLLKYVFRKENGQLSTLLVSGVIFAAIGTLLMVNPGLVINLIPVILGIVLIVEGLVKLQRAVDLARMKYAKWFSVLLLAVISLAFGALVLANPFDTARTLVIIIGIGLVFAGLSGLGVTFVVNKRVRILNKVMDIAESMDDKDRPIDVESRETTGEDDNKGTYLPG